MTTMTTCAPRRPALPAAALIGALALAGCSSGHIGDSWQCPLAEGGACDSVAAADPAVPDAGGAWKTLPTEPLWRPRAGEPGSPVAVSCKPSCGGGFDPFGWLMRLLGGPGSGAGTGISDPGAGARGYGGGDRATAGQREPEPAAKTGTFPARLDREAAASAAALEKAETQPGEPAASTLPAEPARGEDDPGGDNLRSGEVVARIWIAPFVDADGIYREASHVRVVLEPAGWRLPR